ncbi:hypothetical protein D9611_012999 [Ephemerocybe angulata]|uniref:ATP-dependent DNA helicase n=1 Tax=Ephemerocybe angulata TaxID=980116 RepID=A0A8H5AVA2_9AGAR|nr:hypothetical protein D9611_012999 [Tulosesus angulatus]
MGIGFFMNSSNLVVQRAMLSTDTPALTMQSYLIRPDEWCRDYDFHGIIQQLVANDVRLTDPTFLVIGLQLKDLVKHFQYLQADDLRMLARFHEVHCTPRTRVQEVLGSIAAHECNARCGSMLVAFRLREDPRRLKPWQPLTAVFDWSHGWCSDAVPQTSLPNTGAVEHTFTGRQDVSKATCTRLNVTVSATESGETSRFAESGIEPCRTHLRTSGESTDHRKRKRPISSVIAPTFEHLRPLTENQLSRITQEWQEQMDPNCFVRRACASCSSLGPSKELIRANSEKLDLCLLRNDALPPNVLPTNYNFLAYDRAILEPTALENRTRKGWMLLCKACHGDLSKGRMPKFALANWLYYGRDRLPDDVRRAFNLISIFEKALICRVRTNSLLCRFTGVEDDSSENHFIHGRRHIKGNIMSTPLDVIRVNSILPPSPSDIADTICALIVSVNPPTKRTIETLKPVLVRKSRIKLLIDFLVQNNPNYRRCESFKGFSAEYLNSLFTGPEDVGVPASVNIGHVPINAAVDSLTEDYTGRLDGLEGLFMENVSYTTGDHSAQSYREMTLKALQRCRDGRPFLQARAGSTPVPDINNPAWLSWAHPDADPFGIGGFHDPRRSRTIGIEQQLKHLLNVQDPFFENDPVLAFDIYNIIRKASVNSSMLFSVPFSAFGRVATQIASLDMLHIAALRERYQRNPNYAPTAEDELAITRVMASIAPLARNIPGTVSQKIKMRNEIRALISQKGSPTLFVTINPSDYHHPIVSVLASRAINSDQVERLQNLTSSDRAKLALKHPVACAQFFDTVMRNFIAIVLGCKRKKKTPGIFGHCDSYYGTVETQGRGSLHCHMLVWLRDHLPPEKLAKRLVESEEYRAALTIWIDSIMESGFVGARDNENHEHTETSDARIQGLEPHPACAREPKIAELPQDQFRLEMREYVDELLRRFNWHVHTGTCWKYLKPGEARAPENCRFGMDGSIHPSTTIDGSDGTVRVRRRHPRMTTYNPTITFLLKCNTDIKFIGSGADAKAFMYYVTDYITKAPLSMHAGLTALSYAIQQAESRGVLQNHPADVSSARRATTIAVNSMLGRQEISHPQVMSYILGGGEHYTNESFQAINWAEIIRYVMKAFPLQQDPLQPVTTSEDVINPQECNEDVQLAISNIGTNLSASSHLLDYIFRPAIEPYDLMGLYRFIASTRRTSLTSRGAAEMNVLPENRIVRFSSEEHPQFYTHTLVLRRNHAIPVLLGPKIARNDGTEQERDVWGRDMCILFRPWRNPLDLKDPDNTWYDAAITALASLNTRDKDIASNMTLISEGKQARDERPRNRRKAHDHAPDMTDIPDLEATTVTDTTNAYALEPPNYSNAQEQIHTSLYLNDMLGQDRLSAIQACYATLTEPDERAERTDHAKQTHQDDDHEQGDIDSIALQKKFMAKAKRRSAAAVDDPNNMISDGNDRRSTHDDITPQADITRLNDTQVLHVRQRMKRQLHQAYSLSDARNISSNAEQMRAFVTVAEHIIEGGPQLIMYIGGQGGTGKSYLIAAIVELFEILGRGNEVRLGAFTGIAASLIGGNTLHSLLSVGMGKSKLITTAKRLVSEWEGVRYFIIDEISMLSAQFLATLSAKLKTARGDNPSQSQRMYGGMNMIFLGDFFQLSPPTQSSLFSYRLVRNPSFLEARNNSGIDAVAGAYLWRQVREVILLKRSIRQDGDFLMAELLEKIRNRKCVGQNNQPIEIKGLSILEHLRRRDLAYVASTTPEVLTEFRDAPIIVGNKDIRDSLNTTLLVAHARRMSAIPVVYFSRDSIKGQKLKGNAAKGLWNLPSRPTKDSLGQLPMFVGMKVMVTENVSVKFKVVNGSEGNITDIRYSTDAGGRRFADVVYVKLHSKGQLVQAPGLDPGIVPIFPTSVSIAFNVRIGDTTAKSFSRLQVPLIPAYSYTDYKSQGRTLTHAIIDIASSQGQGVYVMLSRVKTLRGLLILRWFSQNKILQEMTGELREEVDRLSSLNLDSAQRFYESHPLEAKRAEDLHIKSLEVRSSLAESHNDV